MLIKNIKSGSWWQYYMCTTHLGKTQFAYPSVAALFPWKFVELCPFLQLISPPYPSDPCLSGVGEHTEPLPSSGQWDGWLYYHYHHLMEQKSFFYKSNWIDAYRELKTDQEISVIKNQIKL